MKSSHVDIYNHDAWAEGYDENVRHEEHPIRQGYAALLDWMIAVADIGRTSRVLELGSGTGNLTQRIAVCGELVCVDISEQMEAIAQPKLAHLPQRTFIADDILQVFERDLGLFDVVLSSYTIHHLTEAEKGVLFSAVWSHLAPNGRAIFGDLMVQNEAAEAAQIAKYKALGDLGTAESIAEEFFWHIDTAEARLRQLGFQVEVRPFSDLSFGILAQKS